MSTNVVIKSVFNDKGVKQAQKSFGSLGGQLGKLGKGLAAAFSVAAIGNFAVSTLKGAEAAAIAQNRLDQVAKSMGLFGAEAGRVSERLGKFAEANELSLGIDADVIKQTQAKLLTFKELAGTADTVGGSMDRATMAALDLAATGFGSAESNAVQLGKAMQDPIGQLGALRKAGVTFTDAEREKIKVMVESGNILEAQNTILTAIETQVGGTAAATASSFEKIRLAGERMKDEVGEALLPVFEKLTPVLISLSEKVGPVLARLMESLAPIFITLVEAIEPLLVALQPVFDAFTLIADLFNDVLKTILPPFIALIDIIAPIFGKLVEAILPLVEKFLPVLSRLLEALMPFIEMIADYLTTFLIPAFEFLADMIGNVVVGYLEILAEALEFLAPIFEDLWSAAKPFFEGLMQAPKGESSLVGFIDSLRTAFGNLQEMLGPLGVLLAPIIRVLDGFKEKASGKIEVTTEIKGTGSGVNTNSLAGILKASGPLVIPVTPIVPGANTPAGKKDVESAKDRFAAVQKVIKNAQKQLLAAEESYERTRFELIRDADNDIIGLRKDALKAQLDLVKESQARLTGAFAAATRLSLGDLFDRTTTTEIETQVKRLSSTLTLSVTRETEKVAFSSVSNIIEGLSKRLAESRRLLTNASQLASEGFSQTFIEQVIETGTETGNALADAILGASPESKAEMRRLFGELETVSETGMDAVAKNIYDKFGLATRELNEQSKVIQDELLTAIADRQAILATSLADAGFQFGVAIKGIKDAFLADLEGFDGWFAGLGKTIDALLAKMKQLSGTALTDVQQAITAPTSGTMLAGAAITQSVAIKEIGNAGGIVVDSMADVAGTIAYLQARIEAGNRYITNIGKTTSLGIDAAGRVSGFEAELAKLRGNVATGAAAGTVININVKADTTQSQAMVGKTIGNIVTKYVTTGGQVLVSGNN